jgi:hypothetical protein
LCDRRNRPKPSGHGDDRNSSGDDHDDHTGDDGGDHDAAASKDE